MKKVDTKGLSKAEIKAKIRERYKGLSVDQAEVIPARKQQDFYDDEPKRVAVYVRVSTDNIQQTSSYELQKNYYEDMVSRNPNRTLNGDRSYLYPLIPFNAKALKRMIFRVKK